MNVTKETGYIKKLTLDCRFIVEPIQYSVLADAKEGITAPQYIRYGDTTAFKKDSRKTDNSDDMEMVINWIGRKLGISMAETYRFLDNAGEPTALISVNVANEEYEQFVSMTKVREILAPPTNSQTENENWVHLYFELLEEKAFPHVPESFESLAKTEQDVKFIIDFSNKLIDKLPSTATDKQGIKKEYLKMIFLDAFIGQVDRTLGNYGLIHNKTTNTFEFSPLFDNATLRKPYTGNGICLVNGFVADRYLVLREIIKYEEVQSIARELLINKFQFIDELSGICNQSLNLDQYAMLMSNVLLGLLYLEKII